MNRKEIRIGLFGFGCVGEGLFQALSKTGTLNASIHKICIKNPEKERSICKSYFTINKYELLDDEHINTIVELIDDADAAFEIVRSALSRGKAVVTANKKMIAEHFEELIALQKQYKVPLLYEAACCASIPIIRNLEEYYDNDLLDSIEGIVNGSTNYILTKTEDANTSYETALKEAQLNGFAESNPILDIGGFDAKFKLQILLAHAFGVLSRPDSIFNLGIDKIGEIEFKYAKEKGYKIKLIAHASRTANGLISAYVLPKFIRHDDSFYHVNHVYNGVKARTYFSDSQFFVGKGAGAYPTSSAVISDISALSYDYKYEYKKHQTTEDKLDSDGDLTLIVLLRFDRENAKKYHDLFLHINESYTNQESNYIIGTTKLKSIKKLYSNPLEKSSVVLLEHAT